VSPGKEVRRACDIIGGDRQKSWFGDYHDIGYLSIISKSVVEIFPQPIFIHIIRLSALH
jgi:hypothetical protein